jgi:glycine/D-amino acid oxidase-like deaminating enzyme
MNRYDVAVIGLGIVGASAAYALALAGARVIALDAGVAGTGTSRTSFAWVNSVHKEPEVYHRLNAEGLAAHHALAAELGADGGFHAGGSLEWAEDDDKVGELRALVQRLAGRGYRAAWISREQALEMEPGLAIPAGAREVVLYAAEGWLDAPRAIARLLAAAKEKGAEIRERTGIRSFRTRGERVGALVVDGGEIEAASVLVCVGPATRAFLAPLGAALPVGRVPGILAVTSRPAQALGRVVHAPGIHLRPDASGGLLLGGTDVDGLIDEATSPEEARVVAGRLLERAARVFPAAKDVRIVDARIGVRPMPADGHTIAGRVPGLANAWMLATHSGVTLGPLLGRLIAEEIVGGTPSAVLAPFRPARFLTTGPNATT